MDQAADALDTGDCETAVRLTSEALANGADPVRARALRAEALRDLGKLELAEADYVAVTRIAPNDASAWAEAASFWFDTLQFDSCSRAVDIALDLDPDCAAAWFVRAMLRERADDMPGAQRCYQRAFCIEPNAFPLPIPLDDEAVEKVVEEALRDLHPSIREWLRWVTIILEDVPDEEVCRQFDPVMPPGEILGCFSGPSMRDRTVELDTFPGGDVSWKLLPPSIVLYRRNLERMAQDEAHLLSELQITVFHEIGHFLGLDEDDLIARGLD